MTDDQKRGRGRSKLSAEEKAANAEARKAGQPIPKKAAAPKGPSVKSVEHDRVRLEDLNDDQHHMLHLQWLAKYEKQLAAKKKADADLQNICKGARSDLGPKAVVEIKTAVAARTEEGQAAIRETMESTMRILRWSGVNVGETKDMFPEDRTPSVEKAKADGKRAGLAGDERKAPSHMGMAQEQAWLDGYAEGQQVLMAGITPKVPMPNETERFDAMQPQETEVAVGLQLDAIASEYGTAGKVVNFGARA